MVLSIGEHVYVKGTDFNGRVTAENGHACKLLGRWFHVDDIERVRPERSTTTTIYSLAGEILATFSVPPNSTGADLLTLVRKQTGMHVTGLVYCDGLRSSDQYLTPRDTAVSAIIGTSKFKVCGKRGWGSNAKNDVCVQVAPQTLEEFRKQHADPMRNDPFYDIPGGKYQPKVRNLEETRDVSLILAKLNAVIDTVSFDSVEISKISIARSLLSDAEQCFHYEWSGFNEEGALVHLVDSKHRGIVAHVMGHIVDISHRSSK